MSTATERMEDRDIYEPSVCLMSWVSWRSIIAGALTTIAVSIVMALLGVALGFTVVNPLDNDPMAGIGIAFGIWSLLSVVVSLGAGGFVAGFFAGNRGCLHGFLVWAAVLVLGVLFSSIAAGMTLKAVGEVVGSGAAGVASSITDQAGKLTSKGVDRLSRSIQYPADRQDPRALSVLRDTGVEQLQPSFWMGQMRDARQDLRGTVSRLSANTDNYDTVIGDFLNRQKERLDAIQKRSVDREAALQGLMQTRGISRDEAERLLEPALRMYNERLDRAESMLNEAQSHVEQ
ncbi:MAG: YrzE family protein, partial [Deltaproteobacteria bacterium]|nr:YrzE family protein [Deltaproteobacteria bacterium]